MILRWYRERLATNSGGTLLATFHFVALIALLTAVTLYPSADWLWWPVVPWFLDFPVSLAIEKLNDLVVVAASSGLPGQIDALLLRMPEPFSSLDLFWVPATTYTTLGTLWHYVWPTLLRRAVKRRRAAATGG